MINQEEIIESTKKLCDSSDVYIVVKGYIPVTDPDNAKRNKNVTFKNNAPFIKNEWRTI